MDGDVIRSNNVYNDIAVREFAGLAAHLAGLVTGFFGVRQVRHDVIKVWSEGTRQQGEFPHAVRSSDLGCGYLPSLLCSFLCTGPIPALQHRAILHVYALELTYRQLKPGFNLLASFFHNASGLVWQALENTAAEAVVAYYFGFRYLVTLWLLRLLVTW